MNQHKPSDKDQTFEGVHFRTVRKAGIKIPDLFYSVICDTGSILLTHHKGGLLGIRPGNWEKFINSVDSLRASKEEKFDLVKAFTDKAIFCPIHVDSYQKNEYGEINNAIEPIEAYLLAVPHEMIEMTKLDQLAVLVGMGHFFEIWSPPNWYKLKYRLRYRAVNKNKTFPDITA